MKQNLPDGQIELICLDLECDFAQVNPDNHSGQPPMSNSFSERVVRLNDDQLKQLQEKLRESNQALTGRAARIAGRQLAVVNAELKRRCNNSQPRKDDLVENTINNLNAKAIPPQFNTPQAAARRIQGIREYYRRRKPSPSQPEYSGQNITSTRWFDTLIKTLRDEASRHEQAAHSYARVPDLFVLHIEHSARAFEIYRIVDMLNNYLPFMRSDDLG
ncbi:MAG: hypothetical protein WC975_14375 [Phycisphaerae bacterium]